MRNLFLALALTIATVAPAFAGSDQSQNEIYGYAYQACSVTTKIAKTEVGQIVITGYVGGFLTGANMFSTQNDFAHGRSLDEVVGAFLNYCKNNPKTQGIEALSKVLIDIDTAYNKE